MQLQAEIPRIIAENKACNLLIGEYRDSEPVLSVCLSFCLCDDILPSVKEVRTAGTVGDYHVGLVRFHGLEFLVRVGDGISSVGLYMILSESITAAMTALWIIYDIASP